jgi:hypothetical protein
MYNDRNYTFSFHANDSDWCQNRYRSIRRPGYGQLFAKDPCADSLHIVADSLRDLATANNIHGADLARFAMNFTKSIPYADTYKTGRYPYETILDGHGNCIDHSVLLSAILRDWGMDVVILHMNVNNPSEGHLAVGLCYSGLYGQAYTVNGRTYFYCEATPCAWGGPCYRDIGTVGFDTYQCDEAYPVDNWYPPTANNGRGNETPEPRPGGDR